MTQKVLRVGSSAGITISKEALNALRIKIGDRVKVDIDAKRGGIVILPLRTTRNDEEFSAWTKEFLAQYGPALRVLAKT
ncbi:MAG: AbrB/MazE/SpoVT family DNA-binding domain-containing protein [bacterium]